MSNPPYYRSRSKALPGARKLKEKVTESKIKTVGEEERMASAGQVAKPALPIDSSLIPWEEIFAMRVVTYPDGVA